MQARQEISSPYGVWQVTTEGDCEGRSVTNLGVFEGYLDEIALKLAGRAYYALRFSPAKNLKNIEKPGTKVQVSLDINTGTWEMNSETRVKFFENLLKGRDVVVSEGMYHACVELIDGKSKEAQKRKANELKRKQALAKLSVEERELLGLGD